MAVSEKVNQAGGELVHGWTIWHWPQVMIQAEFHGVWRSPDGPLLDITPKENGATQILFVRDRSRTYDFKGHRRIDNVRRALNRDPLIGEFFAAKRRVFEYEEAHSSGTGLLMSFNQLEYMAVRAAADGKLIELIKKYLRPDDPCFCGSGREVQTCHGMEALQKLLNLPR